MNQKIVNRFVIGVFVTLYLLTSLISTIHVIDFFSLSNPYWLAVALAIGFEVGAAASLASLIVLDKMNQTLVWFLFILLTAMQIMGNVYYAYINLENFQGWVELFGLIEEDLIYQKRILAIVSGGLLPIIALGFIKSLVDYIKPNNEVLENENSLNKINDETLLEPIEKSDNVDLSVEPINEQAESVAIDEPSNTIEEYKKKDDTDYENIAAPKLSEESDIEESYPQFTNNQDKEEVVVESNLIEPENKKEETLFKIIEQIRQDNIKKYISEKPVESYINIDESKVDEESNSDTNFYKNSLDYSIQDDSATDDNQFELNITLNNSGADQQNTNTSEFINIGNSISAEENDFNDNSNQDFTLDIENNLYKEDIVEESLPDFDANIQNLENESNFIDEIIVFKDGKEKQ
jgi:hypothetical protein